MVIHDPIYGEFALPSHLRDLVLDPAVRRLSQVRLINTPSPSIAALGDIRRYSHTLGVLALALRNPLRGFSDSERKAFHASVLLHDVGTPPFAHLLEYQLSERASTGWNHERMIGKVLWSQHAPEDRAHQIFGGLTSQIEKVLRKSKIDVSLVQQIVEFHHPLSKLIFGTLDLDNLDNVTRMAWGLGLLETSSFTTKLAVELGVNSTDELSLSSECQEDVRAWANIRKRVYEVLLFKPDAMAAQAVLFDAIGRALDDGSLSYNEWSETDEDLLQLLRTCRASKDTIIKDYFGSLPGHAFTLQLKGSLSDVGFQNRREAIAHTKTILQSIFPKSRTLSYVAVDNGTFSKQMCFRDQMSREIWSVGKRSQSVLFYGFVCRVASPPREKCKEAVRTLLDSRRVRLDDVVDCRVGAKEDGDGQRAIALSLA